MISTRWLEKRKPNWSRLEELLARTKGRGIGALDHKDLQELGLLYRQTASDLAIAREDITSSQLTAYLNSLLGRAHNLIYMGNKPKVAGIVRFYSETYPPHFSRAVATNTAGIFDFRSNRRSGIYLDDA